MEAPTYLKHQPLVSVNDYDQIDSEFKPSTDAKALSIGRAQYNHKYLSMKVWRFVNGHWSRQSEELPIHRNLDLTILLLHVLANGADEPNPDSLLVAPKSLVSGSKEAKQEIIEYYKRNDKFLKPRLKEIKDLLNKMEL